MTKWLDRLRLCRRCAKDLDTQNLFDSVGFRDLVVSQKFAYLYFHVWFVLLTNSNELLVIVTTGWKYRLNAFCPVRE